MLVLVLTLDKSDEYRVSHMTTPYLTLPSFTLHILVTDPSLKLS